MKNKAISTIFAITIFAFGANAFSTKADFSGTWILDKTKSEGLPPGMDETMTVKQTEDTIETEIKAAGEQGESTYKDIFILNGKEVEFTPALMGGPGGPKPKGKRTSKWTEDGNGFNAAEEITVEAPDGGQMTIKANRRWRLSPDGKTLTVEMSQETRRGLRTWKRVFAKK